MEVPPGIRYRDILLLEREGIATRIVNMFGTASVEARLFTYKRLSTKMLSLVPVRFFQNSSINNSGIWTRKYTVMGANPTVIDIYSLQFKGVEIRYEPAIGETHASLAAELADRINAETYPDPYEVSATSSGVNLYITINSSLTFDFFGIYDDKYQFEYGYYIKLSVLGVEKEYHLIGDVDNVDYQSFPALDPSYSYDTLTEAPNGIIKYLQSIYPDYRIGQKSQLEEVGTIEISDVPYVVPDSSHAAYDEENSRIIFSHYSPLRANERLNMLYG